eukprot:SAG11_NODE_2071_length_3859_cov_2.770457_4_plen_298_part_00
MAKVPVEPSLARALLAGAAAGVLAEVVTIVAMLGCEEMGGVFVRPGDPKKRGVADTARAHFARDALGDQIALLRCYAMWEAGRRSKAWCDEHWVHARSLSRAAEMRELLLRSLSGVGIDVGKAGARERISFKPRILERARQAMCYGLYMRSAKRTRAGGYFTLGEQRALVLIHPASAIYPAQEWDEWGEEVRQSGLPSCASHVASHVGRRVSFGLRTGRGPIRHGWSRLYGRRNARCFGAVGRWAATTTPRRCRSVCCTKRSAPRASPTCGRSWPSSSAGYRSVHHRQTPPTAGHFC